MRTKKERKGWKERKKERKEERGWKELAKRLGREMKGEI